MKATILSLHILAGSPLPMGIALHTSGVGQSYEERAAAKHATIQSVKERKEFSLSSP